MDGNGMISKNIESEFGRYTAKFNHGYMVRGYYDCIGAYEDPDDEKEWLACPCCGLNPKVWVFENGRQTACGCHKSKYDHFSVHAESIMSCHVRNNGSIADYDSDALRKNWNKYCVTMVNPCNHADLREEGKW